MASGPMGLLAGHEKRRGRQLSPSLALTRSSLISDIKGAYRLAHVASLRPNQHAQAKPGLPQARVWALREAWGCFPGDQRCPRLGLTRAVLCYIQSLARPRFWGPIQCSIALQTPPIPPPPPATLAQFPLPLHLFQRESNKNVPSMRLPLSFKLK